MIPTALDRRTPSPNRSSLAVRAVIAGLSGLAVLVALTGCSGNSTTPARPTTADTAVTPSSTAVPSTPATLPNPSLTYTPGDPNGIGVNVVVTAPADITGEQKAAVQTWTTYWQVSLQAYNTYGSSLANPATLTLFEGVSTGVARSRTLSAIGYQKTKKVHTVGTATFAISSVQVTGGKAVIGGCVDDRTYEVNDQGKTTTPAPGKAPFADVLTRSGSQWLVSDTPSVAGSCPA
jgi:hypothetical protein